METDGLFIAKESAIKAPPMKRVKSKENVPTDDSPLSGEALAALQGMTRESLIELIRKVCSAGWGIPARSGADLIKVAVMSSNEVYEAAMLKAAVLMLSADESKEFKEMAVLWMDREIGKPVERQQIDTRNLSIDVKADEQLLARIMQKMARELPIIASES